MGIQSVSFAVPNSKIIVLGLTLTFNRKGRKP